MTQQQAIHQAELITEFLHDDNEEAHGPYGPGATARVYAEANRILGCELCATYGREHETHCTD